MYLCAFQSFIISCQPCITKGFNDEGGSNERLKATDMGVKNVLEGAHLTYISSTNLNISSHEKNDHLTPSFDIIAGTHVF